MKEWLNTGDGLEFVQESNQEITDILIGRKLGEYRIEELIGIGGMALVFRGVRVDQKFDRTVAIKILPGEWVLPGLHERFLAERKILASLNHNGIAQLYDAGETAEGWPYIVMELVHGQAIDEYCGARRMTPAGCLALLREVANVVGFAHGRGVVHRDIKPSNILVDATGNPKLLDFGIARLADDPPTVTRTQQRKLFTPVYASPEQLLSEPVSVPSDIYQLGVLLYELLSGRRLFAEQTPAQLVARAAKQELPSFHAESLKKMSRPIIAILKKCLQPCAAQRYGDVDQLVGDLDRLLSAYPSHAKQPSSNSLSSSLRSSVCRRGLAIAGALALVGMAGSNIWYAHQLDAAREEAAQHAQRTSFNATCEPAETLPRN